MYVLSDAEQIFLLLGTFYLLECLYWIRPGAIVFRSSLGGWFRAVSSASSALLRNERGGLLWGNLLPLGSSTATQPWPFSLSPDGIYSHVACAATPDGEDEHTRISYSWGDITIIVADQRAIRINNANFVKASSPRLAVHWVAIMRDIQNAPADERATRIERKMHATFDVPSILLRLQEARRQTGPLRFSTLALMLYVFAALPVLFAYREEVTARLRDFPWRLVFSSYGVLLLLTMFDYFMAHRRLLRSESSDRFKHLATMLVSPADAIHSRDVIVRTVLETYHPMALAAVVCRQEAFRRLGQTIFLDALHPLPSTTPTENAAGDRIEHWYRQRLVALMVTVWQGQGIDPLTVAELPSDGITYCPRCLDSYNLDAGLCPRCQLSLIPRGQRLQPVLPPPIELPLLPIEPVPESPTVSTDVMPLSPPTAPSSPVPSAKKSQKQPKSRKKRKR